MHVFQSLLMRRQLRRREGVQAPENLRPVFPITAGQFTGYERMHQHQPVGEKRRQFRLAEPEVINPDGSIGEND